MMKKNKKPQIILKVKYQLQHQVRSYLFLALNFNLGDGSIAVRQLITEKGFLYALNDGADHDLRRMNVWWENIVQLGILH